ncbi:hypothetical protein GCM10010345_84340 [Streptomyces canarius]|uniref:LUD domain-containing protein n=1 Tax=Streptomyces canarius TaxID=285453 RepID=A0ABQ3DFG3_9ACTN|nr:hypothetical protein GCM10010345_84340 [Streptomyces canarius]
MRSRRAAARQDARCHRVAVLGGHGPAVDETFAKPVDAAHPDRAAEALRANGFTVHVADTVTDARELVLSLVPGGASVFTASSEALRLAGITEAVDDSGRFASVRAGAGDLGDDADHPHPTGRDARCRGGQCARGLRGRRSAGGLRERQPARPYASGARKTI